MAPRYNPYSGGYNDLTNNQLKNIALPEKLRCKHCNKWKSTEENKENFSKKQLSEVRFAILHQKSLTVVCVACRGGQVTELECCYCYTIKGLECFSKAQRKNPVAAKCLVCMDEQLNFDPEAEVDQLKHIRGPVRYTPYDGSDDDDYDSDGSTGPTYSYTEDDDTITETGDETTSMVSSSYVSATTGSRETSSYMTRARKVASSNDGVNGSISSASTPIPRPNFNNSNFAKVKTYKSSASSFSSKTGKNCESETASEGGVSLTNSAYDSDEESSTAGTAVPEEHEIVWESDSESEEESDDESVYTA